MFGAADLFSRCLKNLAGLAPKSAYAFIYRGQQLTTCCLICEVFDSEAEASSHSPVGDI
jgi:hypothetical protein